MCFNVFVDFIYLGIHNLRVSGIHGFSTLACLLGFKILQHSQWTVLVSDKDGGFVLADTVAHNRSIMNKLRCSPYIEMGPAGVDVVEV